MSVPQNVRAVRVRNYGVSDAIPSLVVDVSHPRTLEPPAILAPGEDVTYQLSTIEGFANGNVFSASVTIPRTGVSASDSTQLTFLSNAGRIAVYNIGGTAIAPSISYVGTDPVPKSPNPSPMTGN